MEARELYAAFIQAVKRLSENSSSDTKISAEVGIIASGL